MLSCGPSRLKVRMGGGEEGIGSIGSGSLAIITIDDIQYMCAIVSTQLAFEYHVMADI